MTSTPVQRNGAAASGDGGSGTENHSVNLTDSTSTLMTDAINKLDIHDGSGHSKRCHTSNHQGEPAPKPDPSISQGDSIPKPDSTVSQEDSAPKPNPSVSQESLAPKPDPYVSHEYSVPKPDPYVYRMNHETRGKFLIINNKNFCRHTGLPVRSGTDSDAASLYMLFKSFGFDVTLFQDQTASQMFKIMCKAGAELHSNRDCFGLAVLSHGEAGLLHGVDESISITNLIAPIKNCGSLAGKPKLFFFQACRGKNLDDGQPVADGPEDEVDIKNEIRIPLDADFLYAYSTTPGYFSWRNGKKGSWFIQSLCRVLSDQKLRESLDIGRLLNRVCHAVAYEYESFKPSEPSLHGKKQVPSIVSMLTKDLYFK